MAHATAEHRPSPSVISKLFFNILATFAEFEVDLLRLRTREGMAVARAKGKLKGKQPKLTARQQAELARMHATGELHHRRAHGSFLRRPRDCLSHPRAHRFDAVAR